MKENEEQSLLFQWAEWHPLLSGMFHIPNGEKRDAVTGARLKRMGVKAGIPDIFLPIPKGQWHGLFIEMKTDKGRVSENQKTMIEHLRNNGYRVEVCRGFLKAKEVIEEYMQWANGE